MFIKKLWVKESCALVYVLDEAFFDEDDDQEKSCQLLQYVLDCLQKIFLYDTMRFLSKERADALLNPLVDQVRLEAFVI